MLSALVFLSSTTASFLHHRTILDLVILHFLDSFLSFSLDEVLESLGCFAGAEYFYEIFQSNPDFVNIFVLKSVVQGLQKFDCELFIRG